MPLNGLRIRARAWTGFAGIIPQWFSEFSGKERPRSFRRRTDFLEIGHQSGRLFKPNGFEAVHWTYSDAPPLECNGIEIRDARFDNETELPWDEGWGLGAPNIGVVDLEGNLPLNLQRYDLSSNTLPFLEELERDVVLSFLAHALVCGPTTLLEAYDFNLRHPLRDESTIEQDYASKEITPRPTLSWCATSLEAVVADPWLYSLLGASSCVICGVVEVQPSEGRFRMAPVETRVMEEAASAGCVVFPWHGMFWGHGHDRTDELLEVLSKLLWVGVTLLGQDPESACAVASLPSALSSREPESLLDSRDRAVAVWQTFKETANGTWYKAETSGYDERIALDVLLEALEASAENASFVFVSELKTKQEKAQPESLVARIWNECLGPRPIPFDPVARQTMIRDCMSDPELKRHIEAWRQIKAEKQRAEAAGGET